MLATTQSVYELKCSCDQYSWGKQGNNFLFASICAKQAAWNGDGPKTSFTIDDNTSTLRCGWALIRHYHHTSKLQAKICRTPSTALPKNLSVLSIAKTLPVQIHPNKDKAAELHKENPNDFTDPNHKPEIALAVSDFEVFAGFKPLGTLAPLLKLEPLQQFYPQDQLVNFTNEHLRGVVRKMLQVDDSAPITHTQTPPRLADQYDGADPGILVALITVNYLVLQPGQAIYVPADGIHAWLSGDIVECMARSNNLLNFGFCPRANKEHTDLVCDLLTFTPHPGEESMLKPRPWKRSREGKTKVFAAPMSEFDMLETTLNGGEKEGLEAVNGPSVLLATKGGTKMKANRAEYELKEGTVFFVTHNVPLEFEVGGGGVQLYLAFVE